MNCSPDLLEAYLDEEIDAAQRVSIEQHIAQCADCAAAWTRLREQKAGIRVAAPYYAAPPALRESVRVALRRQAAAQSKPPVQGAPWRGLAIAASVLLAISGSWNVLQMRQRAAPTVLAESVVAAHVRSLLGSHLLDVPSSDQHTVKPWFAGQLDFAPVVKDFNADGFLLAGGRIEYMGGRRVAVLVYRRRLHVINLFTWPADPSAEGESRTSRDGYNVVHWTSGAMTYWAVSDVSAPELDRLRQLYR